MTVRRLSRSEVRLPVRVRTGKEAGQVRWVPPTLSRVLHVLKNPRYAGAYFYGRTRQKKGLGTRTLPQDQWKVFIPERPPRVHHLGRVRGSPEDTPAERPAGTVPVGRDASAGGAGVVAGAAWSAAGAVGG